MCILAEGLLEVLIANADGTQLKVSGLSPGTFFGEKSLLTGEPRSATVVCIVDSVVGEISKNCMAILLEGNPELVEIIGRAIVKRDLHNELALSRVTIEEVESKVSSTAAKFALKIRNFFGMVHKSNEYER